MLVHLFPLLALVTALPSTLAIISNVVIANRCLSPIKLWVSPDGQDAGLLGTFAPGETSPKLGAAPTFSGLLYNEGTGADRSNGATQVYLKTGGGYYAIVIDKYGFDQGVSAEINSPAVDGYCDTAICTEPGCVHAWHNINGPVKIVDGQLPGGWVHQCATGDTLTITYCPPPPPPKPVTAQFHPNGNTAKCMDVKGNVRANGTPVQIYDCNGSAAQNWSLRKGDALLRLEGTNFCLDSGVGTSGTPLKIWQCYDGLLAQTFYYTDDKRLAQANSQCVDLPSGDTTNGKVLQSWQCTANNVYQIWTT